MKAKAVVITLLWLLESCATVTLEEDTQARLNQGKIKIQRSNSKKADFEILRCILILP